MENEEKRRLKQLGKALVEKRSKELHALIAQTNPSPSGSDEYLQNEIAIRKKEQILRSDDRVRNAEEMRREFVLHPVDFNLNDIYPGVPGWYWECRFCGDFVPSCTNSRLNCSCGNIHLDSLHHQFAVKDEGQIRLVRLMGKTVRSKRWWQFWK
jgi:hypothetical protein